MSKLHQFNQILDQAFKFVCVNFDNLAEIRINQSTFNEVKKHLNRSKSF